MEKAGGAGLLRFLSPASISALTGTNAPVIWGLTSLKVSECDFPPPQACMSPSSRLELSSSCRPRRSSVTRLQQPCTCSLQPQQLCLSSELQQNAVHAIVSDYVCIQSTATCFSWFFFRGGGLCVGGEGRSMRLLVVLTAHTAAP